jgi:hypothetical protein
MDEFKLDFCGIGVAKAGTTWIARCLGEHPAVCMARFKETNFFLRRHVSSDLPGPRPKDASRYDEGLEWYERMFLHRKPGQLCGEFSPAYFADPESADLLHAHNPRMKLLCCFRNPADAAYAGYHQLSLVRPLPDTFEATLDQYPQLLEYGRYHHNLQPFLRRFPRDSVHLMLFDDIHADPAAAYRGICRFLEIDAAFVPASLRLRVNPRTVLRSHALLRLRCAVRDIFASTAATRKARAAIARFGPSRRIALKLFRLNEKPGTPPSLAPETRRRLVEFYRKDTEALGELLNRDLSPWNEWKERAH